MRGSARGSARGGASLGQGRTGLVVGSLGAGGGSATADAESGSDDGDASADGDRTGHGNTNVDDSNDCSAVGGGSDASLVYLQCNMDLASHV